MAMAALPARWRPLPAVVAVLVGVATIGMLLLLMGMYHPFTKEARIYTLTTPVLPTVKGRIKEVNVGQNAHSVADHTQTNWNGIVGRMELRATDRVWFEDIPNRIHRSGI